MISSSPKCTCRQVERPTRQQQGIVVPGSVGTLDLAGAAFQGIVFPVDLACSISWASAMPMEHRRLIILREMLRNKNRIRFPQQIRIRSSRHRCRCSLFDVPCWRPPISWRISAA